MTPLLRRLKDYFTEGLPPRSAYGPGLKGLYRYCIDAAGSMPPGVERLMKLQPLFALVTSLLCIFLLRKGYEHVPAVMLFVIFAIFYLTFRLRIQERGGMFPKVWDTALLFMVNDMIIFVIPFYFEAITFPSRNMFFALVLIVLAVAAHWYRLYQRFILPYPLMSSIFFSLTFFCVLNLVFPVLLGVRNQWSLLISGVIASISVILFINPHIQVHKSWKNALYSALGISSFLLLLWFGRSFVPPAPLRLVFATACAGVERYSPQSPFAIGRVAAQEEVFFFTAIAAPKGLSEKIFHVWHHNGRNLFAVNVKEIHGGGKQGFKTWSRHRILEGPGVYRVEVWTEGGQLVGAKSFSLR